MVTFQELESQDNVSAGEVITTLEEYANSGAAILDNVVIKILERCFTPTPAGWLRLLHACDTGIIQQIQHPNEAMQFARVKNWILMRISRD